MLAYILVRIKNTKDPEFRSITETKFHTYRNLTGLNNKKHVQSVFFIAFTIIFYHNFNNFLKIKFSKKKLQKFYFLSIFSGSQAVHALLTY